MYLGGSWKNPAHDMDDRVIDDDPLSILHVSSLFSNVTCGTMVAHGVIHLCQDCPVFSLALTIVLS